MKNIKYKKNTIKKYSWDDYSVTGISYAILGVFMIISLFPFVNIIAKSFSADWAINSGKVGLLPIGFNLDSYEYVINSGRFLNSFGISVILMVTGTIISLILVAMAAYPLSKKWLPGTKIILIMYVITMLFSGGLVPNYLLIKKMGLNDSIWAVIFPLSINAFNMLIVKNYFEALPECLEESAKIDGASNMRILFKIILPLSMPVMATICLFVAVGYWNEYFLSMIYINSSHLKTLQLYLRDIIIGESEAVFSINDPNSNITSEGIKMATIIASTIPILCVYPFLQKHFVKGVLIGSVKG